MLHQQKITVIIDYPLTHEYRFTLNSANGFTREFLLKEISKAYYIIYEEEEKTATVKTIPLKQRTGMHNRNQTNGKYGIWGHDINDLYPDEIFVYQTPEGQILLSPAVES